MTITKAGSEFLVNTYTLDTQASTTITALSDGGFVITWQSYNQASSSSTYDIYAQCYTADGSKVGSEFLINTYIIDFQITPMVTAVKDGGFVIIWTSYDQAAAGTDIYAQRYAADGSKAGSEFLVNTYTANE
ncbi:MAG: hypothetical protein K0S11_502, partial [Gammaproteobacteria bacterium]|nr:hypothetical protein [Gammaproteobacteria bacterium]